MASINPDHVKWKTELGRACTAGHDDQVRTLLRNNPINPGDRNKALYSALQTAAIRRNSKQSILLLLLQETNAAGTFPKAVLRATFKAALDNNYSLLVQQMLPCGAQALVNFSDKSTLHRTPLFMAAIRGYVETMDVLLVAGADVNATAGKNRTALTYLAAEEGPEKDWTEAVVGRLLEKLDDPFGKDAMDKSALHWAAINGKACIMRLLLTANPDIETTSEQGRTVLHYAAGGKCKDATVVNLLLRAGADPTRRSEGGWTPLHNAAQAGNLKAVEKLLEANVNVNSTLSSGVTPLHWAAANGHTEVVRCLIARRETKKHAKDVFGSTPMLRAAQNLHAEVVKLLSPAHDGMRLSHDQQTACKADTFKATIVDFERTSGQRPPKTIVSQSTMWDIMYDAKFRITSKHPSDPKNNFRWIHIPANNLAWAETLMTNIFVEEDARHPDSFKAVQKTLTHQHRGRHVHSTFMIPQCSYTRTIPIEKPKAVESIASEVIIDALATTSAVTATPDDTPRKTKDTKRVKPNLTTENDAGKPRRKGKSGRKESTSAPEGTAKNDQELPKLGEKSGQFTAEEDPEDPSVSVHHSCMALFMPYLHFETHERRLHMTETIRSVRSGHEASNLSADAASFSDDVTLVKAYLNSAHSLHPRRTLDQFLYHGFDTEKRDIDQVVYRFFEKEKQPPKLYMVDQLWLWIWGKDLIVTCFPQRWGQKEKHDPLSVLDGVLEDINSKARPPIRSVLDLAMLITSRCSGAFDRHRLGELDYQFLDMFDTSIGNLSVKEPELFQKFKESSSAAAAWLRAQNDRRETQKGASLDFVNDLLDIKEETNLLKELKDIRDELNIISTIFQQQSDVLQNFEEAVCEEQEDATEAKRRFREQGKVTKAHIQDVERMDKQADAIFTSLTQLLDFKQKHANAVEARFAREQASFTAEQAALTRRQGETIMVFTLVTIFFLPMSFIAALFTIDITTFPRGPNGDSSMSLGYVSKFVFGIGLSISLILITVAFLLEPLRSKWHFWTRQKQMRTSISNTVLDDTTSIDTTPAVKELMNQPGMLPRAFTGFSALTERSGTSAARSRHPRDPEWGD